MRVGERGGKIIEMRADSPLVYKKERGGLKHCSGGCEGGGRKRGRGEGGRGEGGREEEGKGGGRKRGRGEGGILRKIFCVFCCLSLGEGERGGKKKCFVR